MKRSFWKSVTWLYFVPVAVSLLMTVVECILINQFYAWFWIPEWLCEAVDAIAYYGAEMALFLALGIAACVIFYKPVWKGVFCTLLPLSSAVIPLVWYCIRHLFFRNYATVEEMMEYFLIDTGAAMYLLVLGAVACLILWAVKGFYALVLKALPQKSGSAFSPKHPVGCSALIFFGGLTAISAVYFTVVGEYGIENFLSLGVELLINTAGYFAVCFGAAFLTSGQVTSDKWTSYKGK